MGREYTKCDAGGVPRLVQKIKYLSNKDVYELTLFDGGCCYCDIDLMFGDMGRELRERLKIGDAEIYQFAEDYVNDIYMRYREMINAEKEQERLLLKFEENKNNV